ncbi:MAG: MMPL family transporter [Acidimicrobiales bacterium]|nr:MMPL family transporter [Acidimicrobiales bacterium]
MSVFLYQLGRACVRHKWRTIGAWLITSIILIGLNQAVGGELTNGFVVSDFDSQSAYDLLADRFPAEGGINAQVVVEAPTGSLLSDPVQRKVIEGIAAELRAIEGVERVVPPIPGQTISPSGTIGLFRVAYSPDLMPSLSMLEDLEETGRNVVGTSGALRIEFGGDLYNAVDEPETGVGEILGLVSAVFVLLLAFGSIVAMGLPIGLALFGLALGIGGIIGLVAIAMNVPVWTPNMASMIGLGVGIDYALFIVTRFREGLADGLTVEDAAGRANATAGLSVIFAGGTVVIAILGLAMAGLPFMTAAAVAVSIVVALMVAASITILPALLGWAGHRVNPKKMRIKQEIRPSSGPGRWQRWGDHVAKHAWPYMLSTLALLLALTAPVLDLKLGFPDQGNVPEERTSRRAYDLLADGFGPGFSGPLLVALDTANVSDQELKVLATALQNDPGVAFVQPPERSPVGEAAIILIFPTTTPQDPETVALLNRIRGPIFSSVLSDQGRAHVGGATASFADLSERVQTRLPIFIAGVIGLSFILLMLVFRSILVPVKAALLNLLSIGAAYGVLVMVFQWGWGRGLIGLQESVPIVSFIPMFMFAVLFGLSMDYEVFLLSRVKEEYLLSGDNSQSVIFGISNTARVITSAALIMISVFLGFVTNPDPIMKMMGLGLATAIFVDATIVRVVLVPASMKLMGDANWWFPRWLEWLPRLNIEGEAALPPREVELAGQTAD